MIQETYLPFSLEELSKHFHNHKHLPSYVSSAERFEKFSTSSHCNSKSIQELKLPCQIQKDETIWTASCFTLLCISPSKIENLKKLLVKAFGPTPPIDGLNSWEECLSPDYEVFFEVQIPSTEAYKRYVKSKVLPGLLVDYIKKSADGKQNLEGPTHVDAIIINKSNGFSIFVEAKVLSDISYQITYDEKRNQLIRNLDVMLEPNPELNEPLNLRNPDRTLFLLLTPRRFKDSEIKTRLYAYKFADYKGNPMTIGDEMPHRPDLKCENLSQRIGWITWEDFRDLSTDFCKWL